MVSNLLVPLKTANGGRGFKAAAAAAACLVLLSGCAAFPQKTSSAKAVSATVSAASSIVAASSSAPAAAPGSTTVSFLAAGDDIIHEQVYEDALTPSGGYDFTPMYDDVEAEIHKFDFAFVNQEGPLGGTSLGLEGYPDFNAPQQVGTALVNAGFNLISQANNHALDHGFAAIANTCAFWQTQPGVVMSGMNASAADYNNIHVLTKKGVRVALIAYTWGLNQIPYPAGKNWCVETDFKDVLSKVRRARTMADVVVVSAHWGVEYQPEPDALQKSQAQQLADAGADIIIGNHPHVIQSPAWITASDGRKVICAYAMGNFLSCQTEFQRLVGGLLELNITKTGSHISISDVRFVPVVTVYEPGYKFFRVYLFSDYTDDLASEQMLSATADMSPRHVEDLLLSSVSPQFYSH